ncbi:MULTISPECIES: cation:proton antiporter [Streptomyces]|uniref:Cation:proton antiporter n=1 Tax=Streptomyces virginiae TaxID=1961 RepID=A0ABZ1TMG3_STRVG|nr:cation:proton antiporter [Streptomyces virginiae]WTB26095.1 cation:proton antiporter [Streptomyces virginiae]
MAPIDLCRLLTGLVLLLLAAHLTGRLFARFRQPSVIGEIVGGLFLGPTLLGQLLPQVQHWIFPKQGPVATGLELMYQLGMLLLMFLAGCEMRAVFSRKDSRTVGVIAVVGMAAPFAFGLLAVRAVDTSDLIGPAGSTTALTLVIACSIAITSIPVISRIMLDLGVIRTAFARVVLSVAVLEDIVLNVVLSVAVGMVASSRQGRFGLASELGIESANASAAYHSVASVAFLGLVALAGLLFRRRRGKADGHHPLGQVAVRVSAVLAAAAVCIYLGVAPMYGAFVIGLMSSLDRDASTSGSIQAVGGFARGFFIPVYFAVVGLKLNLVHDFDFGFTAAFLAVACVVKAVSVYAGARLTKRPVPESVNLAIAMNARGGPGIVLATVALDAGIISASLFTTLVLTAVITSLLAGWWLERAIAQGTLSRDTDLAPTPQHVQRPLDAAVS